MDFFYKNKIVILRIIGVVMLVVGFASYFWVTPKEGVSANDLAATNVARMEAKVAGISSSTKQKVKKEENRFLKEYKNTRAKQIQYLTIFAMILGVGFLGYSFFKPKK
jgi:hypothetical protein